MRGALRFWAAILSAALVLLGCQSLKLAFYTGPLHDVDYRAVYNRWTNEGKIYDRLDTVLFVQATLKSPEFTARYVDTYARAYQLDDKEKRDLAGRLEKEAREGYEFLLSAFSSVEREYNLDSPRSSYKIYLMTPDGRRLKPLDVRRIKKVSEATRDFFPHISPWRKAYTIRFAGPQAQGVVLVVAGPMGKISLKYPSGGTWIYSQPVL